MSTTRMLLGVLAWCFVTAVELAVLMNESSRMIPAVLLSGNVLITFVAFLVLRKSPESEAQAVARRQANWNADIRRRLMGDPGFLGGLEVVTF
eukprot:Skav212107  [mRNA]  locus=scaffold686:161951:162229:- [translate_table: standard]